MIPSQSTFAKALIDPEAPRPAGLVDGAGREAGRRFDVYRNNVIVSLMEALEAAFPVTRKLVGHSNFKAIARRFVQAHPPSSPLMMFYGAQMPAFLRGYEPAKNIGYLPDVARMEIALRDSYHAADAVPIDPTRLGQICPEDLMSTTFSFAPAVKLLQSSWPIHAIWLFNQDDNAPKPEMAAQDVLIVRPELDPRPVLLPPGAAAFTRALMRGDTLGEALTEATKQSPNFDLTQHLTLLISTGAILDIGETP
jgi:hypothetical protein